jgi:mannose-6-phosphate isomerase-like protein (cupin superfamily)
MPKVHSFDANAIDWTAHPQFAGLLIKVLESRATHPHMSMMLVRLAVGGVISTHVHATETETAYVLAGRGVLKLGDNDEVVMEPGRGVSVPPGLDHSLHNRGDVPLELLAIHAPPVR